MAKGRDLVVATAAWHITGKGFLGGAVEYRPFRRHDKTGQLGMSAVPMLRNYHHNPASLIDDLLHRPDGFGLGCDVVVTWGGLAELEALVAAAVPPTPGLVVANVPDDVAAKIDAFLRSWNAAGEPTRVLVLPLELDPFTEHVEGREPWVNDLIAWRARWATAIQEPRTSLSRDRVLNYLTSRTLGLAEWLDGFAGAPSSVQLTDLADGLEVEGRPPVHAWTPPAIALAERLLHEATVLQHAVHLGAFAPGDEGRYRLMALGGPNADEFRNTHREAQWAYLLPVSGLERALRARCDA